MAATPEPAATLLDQNSLQTIYYEGISVSSESAHPEQPQKLRGWYQLEATFDPENRRVTLNVNYEPNRDTMPRYNRTAVLSWDMETGFLQEGEDTPLPTGEYWARWHGALLGGQGGSMRLEEKLCEISLW